MVATKQPMTIDSIRKFLISNPPAPLPFKEIPEVPIQPIVEIVPQKKEPIQPIVALSPNPSLAVARQPSEKNIELPREVVGQLPISSSPSIVSPPLSPPSQGSSLEKKIEKNPSQSNLTTSGVVPNDSKKVSASPKPDKILSRSSYDLDPVKISMFNKL
jgi:hypothetical protein